jgi:MFS family permease
MTGIEDPDGPIGPFRPGRLPRPLQPYADIFRTPGAWCFSAAGVIGRMPMAMFGLGTVLLISSVTGRYGIAGAVSAAGSVGYAFTAPRIGRLTDTHGQRTVLLPLVTVFTAATVLLVVAVQARLPAWTWFVTGTVAKAAMPSLGTMVRTRWSALLADSPRLHTAFSVESVADEVCFVLGPAAVTLLATEVFPAAGVGVTALLCLAGTLWFAAQRRTEPPTMRPGPADPGTARVRRGAAAPGLAVLIPVFGLQGAMFVAIDLSTVSFAQHFGHKPLAGVILGVYALGSAIGGLWYGTRHWHAPADRRFALTLTLTALGVATFWAQPSLITLTGVIFLSGLAIAPTAIAGFSLLDAQASADRRNEAISWLGSGIGVGAAGGASVVGFILDAHGPRMGYVFAAACGLASAVTCLAGLRRLRTGRRPAPSRRP